MLHQLKTAIRRSQKRSRHRRDYTMMLSLEDHILRDIGIRRDDIRASLREHA